MLMRTDPFREFDRLSQQVLATRGRGRARPRCRWTPTGTASSSSSSSTCPASTRRRSSSPSSATCSPSRPNAGPSPVTRTVEMIASERPLGVFSRQLFLGDTLDTEHIDAGYDAGVLTLRIPVAGEGKAPQDQHHQHRQRTPADRSLTRSSGAGPLGSRRLRAGSHGTPGGRRHDQPPQSPRPAQPRTRRHGRARRFVAAGRVLADRGRRVRRPGLRRPGPTTGRVRRDHLRELPGGDDRPGPEDRPAGPAAAAPAQAVCTARRRRPTPKPDRADRSSDWGRWSAAEPRPRHPRPRQRDPPPPRG